MRSATARLITAHHTRAIASFVSGSTSYLKLTGGEALP